MSDIVRLHEITSLILDIYGEAVRKTESAEPENVVEEGVLNRAWSVRPSVIRVTQ